MRCASVAPPKGGVKSLVPLGPRYRVGLTHRFFLLAGGLNYFLEIKEFKHDRETRAIAIRVIPKPWTPARGLRLGPAPRHRAFIFRLRVPGGRVRSLGARARDRLAAHIFCREIPEVLFLGARASRSRLRKCREIQGGGGGHESDN
jgi:hypothetical protein